MTERSIGVKLLVGTTFISKLSSIDAPPLSAETIDSTTLDSVGGYRTYEMGFKDSGEVSISGFYDPRNGGQSALLTAYNSGASVPCKMFFPGSMGIEWQYDAVVTAYQGGSAGTDDLLGFESTVKITGKSNLLDTESTNLTNIATTAGSMTFAATTYEYEIVTSLTSFTVTGTFATGTVDMYVDNTFTASLTTATASAAVTIATGQTKRITLVSRGSVTSAGKVYELIVKKP